MKRRDAERDDDDRRALVAEEQRACREHDAPEQREAPAGPERQRIARRCAW